MDEPLLRAVDAITLRVPDLDTGLAFYRDRLGHELLWRHDALGQAGLRLPDGGAELVLSTSLAPEPTWLVASVEAAVRSVVEAGGALLAAPAGVPVGRLAVVSDPFGNRLVLLDLSVGRYLTDEEGLVTGVQPGSDPVSAASEDGSGSSAPRPGPALLKPGSKRSS